MEERELDQVIVLKDEEGREVQFDLLLSFDYEGKRYIALLPMDPVEGVEENEVVLLEVARENGEEVYNSIDNPVMLEEVFDAFCELFESEIEEDDEEPVEP